MTGLDAWVLSLQVGRVRALTMVAASDGEPQEWRSGIFKAPVEGPRRLGRLGFEGDEQADLAAHGGPHQAVLCYAASHYPDWQAELGRGDLGPGGFGENLTIAGLDESRVCIGDVLAIGASVVEVSQPRRPCWKLGRRHGLPQLPVLVQRSGRGGWYVRVLQEGDVAAGQPLALLERPYPQWTVARVNDVIYRREPDPAVRAALAACPALSPRWRAVLSGSGPDRATT